MIIHAYKGRRVIIQHFHPRQLLPAAVHREAVASYEGEMPWLESEYGSHTAERRDSAHG